MKDTALNEWTRMQNLGLQAMREREAIRQREIDLQAREAQRAEEERRAADARLLATAPTTSAERRTFGEALARTHRVTVLESRTIPAGVWGHACWSQRRITVPPDWPDTESGFAAFLHEVGHIVAGDCSPQEPHRRDLSVPAWHNCLECERLAWREAMKLTPVFSRAMFQRLQGSLTHYRRTTPAPAAAIAATNGIKSDSTYAEHVQARGERERRLEQHAEMEAFAAAAQRPRPLSKLEQQIADIRRWSKE